MSNRLKSVFEQLDKNKDGLLSRDEIKMGLAELGVHQTDEQFESYFALADIDNNGQVDYEEFLKSMGS